MGGDGLRGCTVEDCEFGLPDFVVDVLPVCESVQESEWLVAVKWECDWCCRMPENVCQRW